MLLTIQKQEQLYSGVFAGICELISPNLTLRIKGEQVTRPTNVYLFG